MDLRLSDHIGIGDVAVERLVKSFHVGVRHLECTIDLRRRGDVDMPRELGRCGDDGEEEDEEEEEEEEDDSKLRELAEQAALFTRQQREIRHMESFIERFRAKATKARQAQSRLKALERMQRIAPAHVDSPFEFSFAQPEKLPRPLLAARSRSTGRQSRSAGHEANGLVGGARRHLRQAGAHHART